MSGSFRLKLTDTARFGARPERERRLNLPALAVGAVTWIIAGFVVLGAIASVVAVVRAVL